MQDTVFAALLRTGTGTIPTHMNHQIYVIARYSASDVDHECIHREYEENNS